MKFKLLNLVLVVSSLAGYLQWGTNRHSFLYEAEMEVLSKLFTNPLSVVHPFTLIPLLGQLMLLATLFQAKANRYLTFIGLSCLALLMLLLLLVGVLSLNVKILFSTLPFFTTATWVIVAWRNRKRA